MQTALFIAALCLIIGGILIRGRWRGEAGRIFLRKSAAVFFTLGFIVLLMEQAERFRWDFDDPRNVSHLILFPFLSLGSLLEKWLPGVLTGTVGLIRSAGLSLIHI